MSGSINTAQTIPSAYVHGHHHHHNTRPVYQAGQAGTPASGLSGATAAASPSGSASSGSASPAASGNQSFASELQSILLSAQSGQPGTADQPAAGQGGPIRHLADRLQDLLGTLSPPVATAAGASPAGAAAPVSRPELESVLDTLQRTLQHTLAAYGTQAQTAPATALSA